MKRKSVLVIFNQSLPQKSKTWWQQFDKVVASKDLKEKIQNKNLEFVDIKELSSPGSIQEAYDFVNKLPNLTISDGKKLPKLMTYQGYELWWMHYDSIYYKFCLPYTKYADLLCYLKDFESVYLFQPPCPDLFRYFLKAHNRQITIFNKFQLRNLLPIPLGIFIQGVLSVGFLLWLKISRPKLMIWTSDMFDPPHQFDFRHKFIYQELWKRKTPFVEFIRGLEPTPTVLKHAWQRKRPVVYSAAIIYLIHSLAGFFKKDPLSADLFSEARKVKEGEQRFWFLVGTHYLSNFRGTIWSIQIMKFILRWIGVRVAIIPAGCNRTFHEVLGCKLANIRTVGIQHGAAPQHYFVSDFMPGFNGEKMLSVDKYGLWSNWWKEYYLSYSQAYKPEQLYISGPMRPLEKDTVASNSELKRGSLKVLFMSEQLTAPLEMMPYLLALLEVEDFFLYFKFRSYRDGVEQWLKKNHPDILKKVNILKGSMYEAILQSDIVVGSHSTGVLEALLQLKPFVFFQTKKWGDYFEMKSFDSQGRFFAENPKELVDCIRKSVEVSKEDLKRLQERFFGNPYQNGSKWVVEQALEFVKNYGK